MRLRHLAPLTGGLIVLSAIGCNGGTSALFPSRDTDHAPRQQLASPPLGHYVLEVTDLGATMTPVSSSQALGDAGTYDASGYFRSAPCTDCVRVASFSKTPQGKIAVDIAIRHPYRSTENRLDLDAFDVRGILGVSGAVTFPGTPGILEQPLTTDPGVLLNADGYTTHFSENLPEGSATLNPFRRFFTEDNPSPSGEGEFILWAKMPMASDWDIRRYLLEPANGPVSFDFILEASYGQSAKGPQALDVEEVGGRLNPTYYNPEFNQKEAFFAGFTVNQAPAAAEGGDLTLSATILDWQQGFLVEEFYPFPSNSYGLKASSNVGAVSLEIPGLGVHLQEPTTAVGSGATDDPMLATFVAAIDPQPAGLYPALLVVEDELYDQELVTESRQDLRGFHVTRVRLQESVVTGEIPVAVLTSAPTPATAYLRDAEFIFYGSNSYDPDLVELNRFEFDWDYDGVQFDIDYLGTDPFEAAPTHRYITEGSYTVALRVGNAQGELSEIVTLPVTVNPDPIIPSPSLDWTSGTNLSGDAELVTIGGASDSSVVVAPNGTTHVVWIKEEEGIFLGTDVYVYHIAIPVSGVPGAITEVHHELSMDSITPRSAVGVMSNNTVGVIWALTDEIWYTQRNGTVWSEPFIAAAADGFGGESLGSFDLVGSGNKFALAYETCLATNDLPARVYVAIRESGAFGTEGIIGSGFGVSGATPGTLWPHLTTTPSGFLVTWAGGNAPDNLQQDVFMRRYNGTAWSAKETIASDPALGEIEPTTAIGPDGSIAVAWRNGAGVFGRVARTGETFGPVLNLFTNGSGRVHTAPVLVAGPNGALACAVLEKDGDPDPGTIVTLAFHKDHSDPSYYGLRSRGLAANTGPVYLNLDLSGNGQNAVSGVAEFRQVGWSYIRLLRGTFVQP